MSSLFIKILVFISLFNCNNKSYDNRNSINKGVEKGFLFVKISKIYHTGGELEILDRNKKVKFSFKNKKVFLDSKNFEIMNEEHLYRGFIKVESFYPEYSLFILESTSEKNGFYQVKINGEIHFIDSKKYQDLLSFKTQKEYVLDSYPHPDNINPLRVTPHENAQIVEDFTNYVYLSVEIKGDWLKVKDDKECYIGTESSKEDIIGWVRWRKDGKIILDIRHNC